MKNDGKPKKWGKTQDENVSFFQYNPYNNAIALVNLHRKYIEEGRRKYLPDLIYKSLDPLYR